MRLFHVSDLHFGRADEAALDWFAAAVARERPDAVIITGDLTMRARSTEYAAATAWLKRLDVPVSIEPGNHDLPYHNPVMRFLDPYRRYRRVERMLERPLDLPGIMLVPLKTTARFQWRLNWSFGKVSGSGLEDALTMLTRRRPGDLAIVACHHPLVDQGLESEGRTKGGEQALARLAQAGADAVLSGHVHDPFDVSVAAGGREIRLIGAGTLSERTRATPPSFNELTVTDGRLAVIQRMMD